MKQKNRFRCLLLFGVYLCLIIGVGSAAHAPGTVVGWGNNVWGQTTPPEGNNYISIAAGGYHSLALKSDGSIVGWGQNGDGQATPPAGNDFIAIAAGGNHSLALKSDGSIVGWGNNSNGQAAPPAGNDFIAIAAGRYHSLALKSDGSIVGWGDNSAGQVTPPAGNDFIAISAGYWQGIALRSNGSVVGWGRYTSGMIEAPPAGNDFTAIAAGANHGLALRSNGSIVGWGDNSHGEVTPPAGNDFVAIAAGWYHSLALKSDGSIVAWGLNSMGQATPPTGYDFVAITGGGHHSLALKAPFWSSPGGHTLNSIAMDANPDTGQWFAIIRGTDNHVYFNKYTYATNTWSGWTSIGGTTNDEPAVAYSGNFFHVVVRGTDNVLYHKKLNVSTNTWDTSWASLGGHASSAPTLIPWSYWLTYPGDHLFLAIRGTDNHVYAKQWNTSGWYGLTNTGWTSLGGTTYDSPTLAFKPTPSGLYNILTVGVRGTDNQVWTKEFSFNPSGSSTGAWVSKGLLTASSPVILYKNDIPHIIVRGTDNVVYHKAGLARVDSPGGKTDTIPAVCSWPSKDLIEVSIRSTNSGVFDTTFNTDTHQWTGWTSMKGSTASHPTLSRGMGSEVNMAILAIRGTDNGIYFHIL